MKIALLLVGRLDTFEDMYPSLKENILDPFLPDVFFLVIQITKELNIVKKKLKIFGNQKNIFLKNIMKM